MIQREALWNPECKPKASTWFTVQARECQGPIRAHLAHWCHACPHKIGPNMQGLPERHSRFFPDMKPLIQGISPELAVVPVYKLWTLETENFHLAGYIWVSF